MDVRVTRSGARACPSQTVSAADPATTLIQITSFHLLASGFCLNVLQTHDEANAPKTYS